MRLTVSEKQIGGLLPAFLNVDAFLNITALGPGIARHLPHVRIGMPCDEAFSILNFETAQFFREGPEIRPVQLISRVGDLPLSGAAVFHEGGCLLAVRFALSEKIFADGSMDLSDFGFADTGMLSTMLIALQRAMLEESQATAIESCDTKRNAVRIVRNAQAASPAIWRMISTTCCQ
ncbi:MAG: hypothetical protein HEQ34_10005 [Sphingorhabdus sp.]|uniref:hypothetical protein n=1 Tax=Sphingorhabdus sp. TaxID=1902408 RepID=UPI0025E314B6|nr:hypothetical protein [Sphingorhabdus sp.]MCO4092271.1 hypothetical protein [Sphingorhabdus sp.]